MVCSYGYVYTAAEGKVPLSPVVKTSVHLGNDNAMQSFNIGVLSRCAVDKKWQSGNVVSLGQGGQQGGGGDQCLVPFW
jgi:hypothetical protein